MPCSARFQGPGVKTCAVFFGQGTARCLRQPQRTFLIDRAHIGEQPDPMKSRAIIANFLGIALWTTGPCPTHRQSTARRNQPPAICTRWIEAATNRIASRVGVEGVPTVTVGAPGGDDIPPDATGASPHPCQKGDLTMRLIRHWIIATILIAALAASACGDDEPTTPTAPTPSTPTTTTPTPTTPTTPTATSLAIDGPSELEVGETVQYRAMVTYSDGETNRVTDDVEWVSGNMALSQQSPFRLMEQTIPWSRSTR